MALCLSMVVGVHAADTAKVAKEPVEVGVVDSSKKDTFAVAKSSPDSAAVAAASAAPAAPTPSLSALSDLRVGLDTVWVLVAGMLVFFMNLGFALVESGLARAKNCVNILAKNFIVFAASTISFYVIGWGLMFGDGNLWVGLQGLWFVSGADNSPSLGAAYAAMNPFSTSVYEGVYSAINWTAVPLWAKFFFQLVFAGTAATIVSGAVAERIKFSSFLIFSFLLVAFVYPISGHWIWGGGILGATPGESGLASFFGNFRDFAGSSVVHSVGGWAALAGVIVLGPRIGKFVNGKARAIPGHNMTSAATGVLVLWLGWFGFNPGSTMSAGNGFAIAHVLVNTNIAAATGALGALITAWILLKKPDLSMVLNGCLAGLVAITAPCAFVSIPAGAFIGFVGGVIVVFFVLMFDKLKLDDPVGALSVHLGNGIWGTLALGIFYSKEVATGVAALDTGLSAGAQFVQQLKGVFLVGIWAFGLSMIFWLILKYTMGIRVSQAEEIEGLDIGEHGNEAYPDFQSSVKG
ncbi:MAG TPA: ammonium transporter [Fibrobacteria bacterium]|nr:ammonium transporter [Fibrobacteria bacterium]